MILLPDDSDNSNNATITVCSEGGNATCTAQGNRICLQTIAADTAAAVNETCGHCAFGYLEWQENCLNIETDIDYNLVLDLIDEYAPQYSNPANVSDEERVESLQILAALISYYDSRIPPLPFRLGLNRYSLDTAAERRQRLGTSVRNDTANVLPRYDFAAARRHLQQREQSDGNLTLDDLPSAVDHATAGHMTEVKDQGRCGCWCVVQLLPLYGYREKKQWNSQSKRPTTTHHDVSIFLLFSSCMSAAGRCRPLPRSKAPPFSPTDPSSCSPCPFSK